MANPRVLYLKREKCVLWLVRLNCVDGTTVPAANRLNERGGTDFFRAPFESEWEAATEVPHRNEVFGKLGVFTDDLRAIYGAALYHSAMWEVPHV